MSDPIDLDDVRQTIPERVIYDPQTLEVHIPAGKTLRIETTPDGEEPVEITASNGTDLIATIIVIIKEG